MCRFLKRGHHVFVDYIFVSEVRKASFAKCAEKLYLIIELFFYLHAKDKNFITKILEHKNTFKSFVSVICYFNFFR